MKNEIPTKPGKSNSRGKERFCLQFAFFGIVLAANWQKKRIRLIGEMCTEKQELLLNWAICTQFALTIGPECEKCTICTSSELFLHDKRLAEDQHLINPHWCIFCKIRELSFEIKILNWKIFHLICIFSKEQLCPIIFLTLDSRLPWKVEQYFLDRVYCIAGHIRWSPTVSICPYWPWTGINGPTLVFNNSDSDV